MIPPDKSFTNKPSFLPSNINETINNQSKI